MYTYFFISNSILLFLLKKWVNPNPTYKNQIQPKPQTISVNQLIPPPLPLSKKKKIYIYSADLTQIRVLCRLGNI